MLYYTILYYTQEGHGSVRFISVPDFLLRFGSEMYFSRFDAVRLAFFRHAVARSGSVRFGAASGSGRFRPVPELNGSVRFGRFGSVSHSFLSLVPPGSRRGLNCMHVLYVNSTRESAHRVLTPTRRSLLCDHSRSSTCTCAPSMCVLSV